MEQLYFYTCLPAVFYIGYVIGERNRDRKTEALESRVKDLLNKNKDTVQAYQEMEAHLLNQIYLIYTGTGNTLKVYREKIKGNREN